MPSWLGHQDSGVREDPDDDRKSPDQTNCKSTLCRPLLHPKAPDCALSVAQRTTLMIQLIWMLSRQTHSTGPQDFPAFSMFQLHHHHCRCQNRDIRRALFVVGCRKDCMVQHTAWERLWRRKCRLLARFSLASFVSFFFRCLFHRAWLILEQPSKDRHKLAMLSQIRLRTSKPAGSLRVRLLNHRPVRGSLGSTELFHISIRGSLATGEPRQSMATTLELRQDMVASSDLWHLSSPTRSCIR